MSQNVSTCYCCQYVNLLYSGNNVGLLNLIQIRSLDLVGWNYNLKISRGAIFVIVGTSCYYFNLFDSGNNIFSTYSKFTLFDWNCNLNITHHRHICNCWHSFSCDIRFSQQQ